MDEIELKVSIPRDALQKLRRRYDRVPVEESVARGVIEFTAGNSDEVRVSGATMREVASRCGADAINSENDLLAAVTFATGVKRGMVTFEMDPALCVLMQAVADDNKRPLSSVVREYLGLAVATGRLNEAFENYHLFFEKPHWGRLRKATEGLPLTGATVMAICEEWRAIRKQLAEQKEKSNGEPKPQEAEPASLIVGES
jgi:hypothetical protein